jgi:hypothetical protein
VAPRAPRPGHPRRGHLHPALAAGPNGGRRNQVIYYQYRHDRVRRTLRGIDEQVRKAEQAVAGEVPVKRNWFRPALRRHPVGEPRARGEGTGARGLKGYITNLRACPDGTPVTAEFVIGAYHQLFQIEKSFRMAKATCRPGPSTTGPGTRSRRT